MNPSQPILLTENHQIENLAKTLEGEKAIGVDTEFIRETSFFPRIALIQVATDSQVWLIDPTVLDKKALEPLIAILTDPKILKVIHAAHADQECFYWSYGVMAAPVLDTAVAAGLCGMGDSIGLQKLLREVLGVHVAKGRARAKWLVRPLSHELLQYAEQDVLHLVELGRVLSSRLNRKNRMSWALEESEVDPKVFDISAEEMAEKIAKGANLEKEQPILTELIRWREDRARDANLPRMWVADNELLISLARVQPKSIDELRTFRGLHPKEVDRNGKKILEAIEKGRALLSSWKIEPRVESPRTDPHAADFIQTYISFLSDELEIMPRYLISAHQAMRILHFVDQGPKEWVKEGILSQYAADLVGEDLKALFCGQKALALKNKRLAVFDL